MSSKHSGHCSCGSVKYHLTSDPIYVHCCHCRWCQRETGTAFALNALIETDRVIVETGSLEAVKIPTNSGKSQKIYRCSQCKIAIWSHYATPVGDKVSFVRIGTLDHPERIGPDIHIFTSSKQPWLELSDKVPVMQEFYDPKQYWPAQSLARYKKLMG